MEWRVVCGSDQYEISESGQLRRKKKTGGYFYQQPGIDRRGYYQYTLSHQGHTQTRKAATLVAEAFVGARPVHMTINHKDGHKTNNHYTNLEYCSQAENVRHAHRLGLMPRTKSRCTYEQADNIKHWWATGQWSTYTQLAAAIGVSARVVALIVRGVSFRASAEQASKTCALQRRQEYVQGFRIAPLGEASANSKLTDTQRGEIITQALSGVPKRQLARRYGVAHTTVNTLLKNFVSQDKYKKFVKST
jgi:uncharacterized protein YhbP (UPF0306 family)